ncbi:hypothetical protein LTR08_000166 [Meristemomyces frigidus]|nr:hypothetical protein LTR08_000166 [Meristemomyces frigidus]
MDDASGFKAVVQSLLNDAASADFTIICGGNEYKTHQFVLKCHSPYFIKLISSGFKESKTYTVELSDNETAVDVMIHYFYNFDYPNKHSVNATVADILNFHASIYLIADKYQVGDLMNLAVRKFGLALKDAVKQKVNPMPAMHTLLSTTPAIDTHCMNLMTTFWLIAGPELVGTHGKDVVDKFLEDTPELAMGLIKRYTHGREGLGVTSEYYCKCGTEVVKNGTSIMLYPGCDTCMHEAGETTLLRIGRLMASRRFW